MGEVVNFPVPYENARLKALGEIEKELERLVEIHGWEKILLQFRGFEIMREFNRG